MKHICLFFSFVFLFFINFKLMGQSPDGIYYIGDDLTSIGENIPQIGGPAESQFCNVTELRSASISYFTNSYFHAYRNEEWAAQLNDPDPSTVLGSLGRSDFDYEVKAVVLSLHGIYSDGSNLYTIAKVSFNVEQVITYDRVVGPPDSEPTDTVYDFESSREFSIEVAFYAKIVDCQLEHISNELLNSDREATQYVLDNLPTSLGAGWNNYLSSDGSRHNVSAMSAINTGIDGAAALNLTRSDQTVITGPHPDPYFPDSLGIDLEINYLAIVSGGDLDTTPIFGPSSLEGDLPRLWPINKGGGEMYALGSDGHIYYLTNSFIYHFIDTSLTIAGWYASRSLAQGGSPPLGLGDMASLNGEFSTTPIVGLAAGVPTNINAITAFRREYSADLSSAFIFKGGADENTVCLEFIPSSLPTNVGSIEVDDASFTFTPADEFWGTVDIQVVASYCADESVTIATFNYRITVVEPTVYDVDTTICLEDVYKAPFPDGNPEYTLDSVGNRQAVYYYEDAGHNSEWLKLDLKVFTLSDHMANETICENYVDSVCFRGQIELSIDNSRGGDNLSFHSVSSEHGRITNENASSASFSWVPNPDWWGTTRFWVELSDYRGERSRAAYVIKVPEPHRFILDTVICIENHFDWCDRTNFNLDSVGHKEYVDCRPDASYPPAHSRWCILDLRTYTLEEHMSNVEICEHIVDSVCFRGSIGLSIQMGDRGNGTLVFTNPDGKGTFSDVNNSAGTFTWSPNEDFWGTTKFWVEVNNALGIRSRQAYTIKVPEPERFTLDTTVCIESQFSWCDRGPFGPYDDHDVGHHEWVDCGPEFGYSPTHSRWCILDYDTFPRFRNYVTEEICYGDTFDYNVSYLDTSLFESLPYDGDQFRYYYIEAIDEITGCIEEHHFNLTFLRRDLEEVITATINEGEDYTFEYNGIEYTIVDPTESGSYPVDVSDNKSENDCESTVIVRLTITSAGSGITNVYRCFGEDSYSYIDPITDELVTITDNALVPIGKDTFDNVIFEKPSVLDTVFYVNETNDDFVYWDDNVDYKINFGGTGGPYEYTIKSSRGCDSLKIRYWLEELPEVKKSFCHNFNKPFNYEGQSYSSPGVYRQKVENELHLLTVRDIISSNVPIEITYNADFMIDTVYRDSEHGFRFSCIGFPELTTWRLEGPITYNIYGGVYSFTLISEQIYTKPESKCENQPVNITVPVPSIETYRRCGAFVEVNGEKHFTAGTFGDRVNCNAGNIQTFPEVLVNGEVPFSLSNSGNCPCDGRYKVIDVPNSELPQVTRDVNICEGDTVVVDGQKIFAAGRYQVRLPSGTEACDTFATINVTLTERPRKSIDVFEGWTYGGCDQPTSRSIHAIKYQGLEEQYVPEVTKSISMTEFGCTDTIFTEIPYMLPVGCVEEEIYICDGNSIYEYPGSEGKMVLNGFGLHEFEMLEPGVSGHEYKIRLVDARSNEIGAVYDTTCPGDVYTNGPFSVDLRRAAEGSNFYRSRRIKNEFGCDSTVELFLYVRSNTFERTEYFCPGQDLVVDGIPYPGPGTYTIYHGSGDCADIEYLTIERLIGTDNIVRYRIPIDCQIKKVVTTVGTFEAPFEFPLELPGAIQGEECHTNYVTFFGEEDCISDYGEVTACLGEELIVGPLGINTSDLGLGSHLVERDIESHTGPRTNVDGQILDIVTVRTHMVLVHVVEADEVISITDSFCVGTSFVYDERHTYREGGRYSFIDTSIGDGCGTRVTLDLSTFVLSENQEIDICSGDTVEIEVDNQIFKLTEADAPTKQFEYRLPDNCSKQLNFQISVVENAVIEINGGEICSGLEELVVDGKTFTEAGVFEFREQNGSCEKMTRITISQAIVTEPFEYRSFYRTNSFQTRDGKTFEAPFNYPVDLGWDVVQHEDFKECRHYFMLEEEDAAREVDLGTRRVCKGEQINVQGLMIDTDTLDYGTNVVRGEGERCSQFDRPDYFLTEHCYETDARLRVIVDSIDRSDIRQMEDSFCLGSSYTFGEKTYTDAGVYEYVEYSIGSDCGKLTILTLRTFEPQIIFVESNTICEGDVYEWEGMSFTSEGIYYSDNSEDCERKQLNLSVEESPDSIIVNRIVCPDESTLFNNTSYPAGMYTVYVDEGAACKQKYVLFVEEEERIETFVRREICVGEEVLFNGRIYTSEGVFDHKYTSTGGCDSTVFLRIDFKATPDISINNDEPLVICKGNPFNLGVSGENYDQISWQSELDFVELGGDSIQVVDAGEYTITAINQETGCQTEQTLSISQTETEVDPEFIIPARVGISQQLLTSDITIPIPDSVIWEVPEGSGISISDGALSQEIMSFTQLGVFVVKMKAYYDGCAVELEKSVEVVTDDVDDGSGEGGPISHFGISPNPTTGSFTLTVQLAEAIGFKFMVRSFQTGAIVFEKEYPAGDKSIIDNIELPTTLAATTYLAMILTEGGDASTRNLILTK